MKIRPKTVFVAIIVCLLIALLLWPINIEHAKPKHIKIVTTIFPAYDFARTISANTDVSLKLLIKPGVDLHNYEPTPQDIINIKESDIFIYNGGESEKWVEKIIADINQSTDVIRMMDLVQLKIESDEHSDEHSDALDYDEHIWTSPKNVIKISSAIANTIANRTPNNATTVRRNYDRFESSLKKLDTSFQELAAAKTGTLVVADRFPFRYFVDDYGFDYIAAFPGCAEQTEASPKTIAELIEKVNQNPNKIIFKLELSNGKTAQTIAEATKSKILVWHSAHNISQSDFDSGKTYLDFMKDNLANLKEALYDYSAS